MVFPSRNFTCTQTTKPYWTFWSGMLPHHLITRLVNGRCGLSFGLPLSPNLSTSRFPSQTCTRSTVAFSLTQAWDYTSQCSISSLSCLVGVGMAKWNQFSVSFAFLTVVKFPARRMYISQIGGTRPGHSFRVYKNGIYSWLPPFPVLLVATVSPNS